MFFLEPTMIVKRKKVLAAIFDQTVIPFMCFPPPCCFLFFSFRFWMTSFSTDHFSVSLFFCFLFSLCVSCFSPFHYLFLLAGKTGREAFKSC